MRRGVREILRAGKKTMRCVKQRAGNKSNESQRHEERSNRQGRRDFIEKKRERVCVCMCACLYEGVFIAADELGGNTRRKACEATREA